MLDNPYNRFTIEKKPVDIVNFSSNHDKMLIFTSNAQGIPHVNRGTNNKFTVNIESVIRLKHGFLSKLA